MHAKYEYIWIIVNACIPFIDLFNFLLLTLLKSMVNEIISLQLVGLHGFIMGMTNKIKSFHIILNWHWVAAPTINFFFWAMNRILGILPTKPKRPASQKYIFKLRY